MGAPNENNYESQRNTRLAGTPDSQGVITPSVALAPSGTGASSFGSSTTHTYTTVSVGTSSAQALAANTAAKYRSFQNISTATITIAHGIAAVINTQIDLGPGQIYEESLTEGNLDTRAVNAIASVTSSNLLVIEAV